jgi:hypothetical protein
MPERLARDKHSSLFGLNFIDEEEIEAFEALTRIADYSIKFGVNVQT